tara:strand:+ start:95 stop:202 length:108 start_codon:yes stop_codon:yes gene_type:complete
MKQLTPQVTKTNKFVLIIIIKEEEEEEEGDKSEFQ